MHFVPREASTPTPQPYEVPPSQEWDGNDGSWSTFKITIGTPPQEFRVLASTQSGQTFTVMPDGCIAGTDPSNCAELRGAQIFDSAQSPGFLSNTSSTWDWIGQYDIDLEDRLNYTARGIFGYERIALGSSGDTGILSANSSLVGGVADMAYYMGHVPLGVSKSKFGSQSQSLDPLIYQLRNTSQIPTMSFAYTAGAKYRLKSVLGQLILGGYDPTRFEPNTNDFSFSFSADPTRLLTVGVDSIIATNTLQGTQSLSSSAHFSLIDSTTSMLWLPRDICDAFETSFGLKYDPKTDLYLINDTMRDQLRARNPSVAIKVIDSLEGAATNFTNIELPYSAFDLQASYPYYENATNYFPIRRAANESQYTLGRTLLQEAYIIVDYERANFTLAQAAFPNPLPPAAIVAILPQDAPTSFRKSALTAGAKAGIAIGCIAFVSLLASLAFWFYRRCRRRPVFESMGAHGHSSELGGIPVSELSIVSPHDQKIMCGAQELAGTPRSELAGPPSKKPFVSVNEVPQELETPSSTIRPKLEAPVGDINSYRSSRVGDDREEIRSALGTHLSQADSDEGLQLT
jgi:hypothetical protein